MSSPAYQCKSLGMCAGSAIAELLDCTFPTTLGSPDSEERTLHPRAGTWFFFTSLPMVDLRIHSFFILIFIELPCPALGLGLWE